MCQTSNPSPLEAIGTQLLTMPAPPLVIGYSGDQSVDGANGNGDNIRILMRSCHPREEPNTGDHNEADFLSEPGLKTSKR